jgi:hypothetical protein
MDDVKLTKSDIVVGVLQLFPPTICETILDQAVFRARYDLHRDANIRFDPSAVTINRSKLFAAIRALLGTSSTNTNLVAEDGLEWRLELDQTNERHIVLFREGQRVGLPDFRCLSPDSAERVTWFDREAERLRLNDLTVQDWRQRLGSGPVEDEEVDVLLTELRLTPLYVAGELSGHLRRSSINIGALVPADTRYYDRLVGRNDGNASLRDFVVTNGREHIARLVDIRAVEGLQFALLMSSHGSISQVVDLGKVNREDVVRLFQWLEKGGDPLSQLGGIELGLLHLETYPELEPYLLGMTQALLADDPDDKEGRLSLLSSLIVLVDGELARIGLLRTRPPFWRRLAAITQAALIQRQMIAAGTPPRTFHDWAIQGRGQLFYLQTLADLRTEPRWMPDFVLPNQLKAEFLGRIASAAQACKAKIQTAELKKALLGKGPGGVQSQMQFPFPFLPGPLEGGTESMSQMPTEFETDLRRELEADTLTPKSFATLVNSALIFRIGPTLAQLAAQALRRVKYQLREVGPQNEAFSLLSGLATVAAVTRSSELAEEVRILARVVRRRAGIDIEAVNAMRIGLIAAASNRDSGKWCRFVGDWITELAFEDIGRDMALTLRQHIKGLCHAVPPLWETCARAEAACAAFEAA